MEVLFLRVGDAVYVAPLASLAEVLMPAALRAVPTAPPFLRGLLNLRGHIVPVIDLRERLHLPERGRLGRANRVLRIQTGHHDLGVIVDEVLHIGVLNPEQRRRSALSHAGTDRLLGDLWEVGGTLVQQLNLGRLLSDAELEAMGDKVALEHQADGGARESNSHQASTGRLAADARSQS